MTSSKTMMIPALISHELHQQLLDRKSYQNRTYGVEKLKRVLSEVDIKSVPCESIEEFINFLPGLLDDSNFKVMFSTLQVLNLLIQKLDMCANKYFKHIVLVALKALGDARAITRNEYLNVFRQLMKTVPPQHVLDLVIGNLKHKKSRVREDVLNVIMVAILSHPRIEFDIPKLCKEVAPYLVDSKRKVRHSAFELFALFDYCLESGKKHPLINAVNMVELNEDAEGLMEAVEARRARHALPKLSSDGILEYGLVLIIPRQRCSLQREADLDWVMNGPRVSSARSYRSEPDSDRLYGYGSLGSLTDDLPLQRRIASAGKGKNKLPWEMSSLSSTDIETQPSNMTNGKCSQQVESNNFIAQPREPETYVPSFGSGEPVKSRRREFPVHLRRSGSLNLNPDVLKLSNISDKDDGECKGSALFRNPRVEQTLSSNPTAPEIFFLPSSSHSAPPMCSHTPPMAPRHAASSLSKSSTWPNNRESSPLRDAKGFNDDFLDRQEMINSLRSLHNSAAKKRAKANLSSLDRLDSMTAGSLDSSYISPERTNSDREGFRPRLNPSLKASPGKSSLRMTGASEKLRASVSMDLSRLQGLSQPDDFLSPDVGVVKVSSSSPGLTPLPKQTFFLEDSSPNEPSADIYSHVQPEKDPLPSIDEVKKKEMRRGFQTRDKIRRSGKEMSSYPQEDDERSTINKELPYNSNSDESTLSPTSPIKFYTPTSPHQAGPPTETPNKTKRRRSLSRRSQPSQSPSSDEITHDTEDLTKSLSESLEYCPVQKPDMALKESLDMMRTKDWEKKVEGMKNLRSLAIHNPDVIQNRLHDVCLCVIEEVRNQRTTVSSFALCTMGDLYTHLEKAMDRELDETVKMLLKKAGESNTFIKKHVDDALNCMVQYCTPSRSLHALIMGGLNDRNKVVRKCTGQHLAGVVTKIGVAPIVSGTKDITEKLIPAIGKLAQDACQEARFFGRQMLLFLSDDPNLDNVLEKYLTSKDLATIKKTVEALRTKGQSCLLKGLNDEPLESQSARGRRSQPGTGTLRGPSLNREPLNKTNKSQPQSVLDKNLYIKHLSEVMGSKDFKDRIQAIDQIVEDSQKSPSIIISNLHPVFDAITAWLLESNSKVNLHALEALPDIVNALEENLVHVVNALVPAIVDNHLNSKNNPIFCAAIKAIDALITNLDNTHLLQIFCSKAKFLNGKAKAVLIEKVAVIFTNIYHRKPQVVKQKVLPLLWHLLGLSTHSSSIHNLCDVVYMEMGSELIKCAASQPLNIRTTLNKNLSSFGHTFIS